MRAIACGVLGADRESSSRRRTVRCRS